MADLFERLFPPQGVDCLGVHTFRAVIGDYAAGYTTRQEMITHWDLDSEAQADLNALCDAIDGMNAAQAVRFLIELHDVMLIADTRIKYNTKSAFRARMGL